ncbi:MAG: hypothetical protein IJO44_04880 [Clostridia bacterium]|nr:hypothetical protein [Clostridia bacterium]
MKKRTIFISVMMCLLLIFSSFSVFAEDVAIIGGADGETEIIVGDEEIVDESIEEDLEEVFGEDFMGAMVFLTLSCLFSMLSLPALIFMIVFIVKNNKAKKDIKEFELRFGPVSPIYNGNQNNYNATPYYNNSYNGFNNNQGGQM